MKTLTHIILATLLFFSNLVYAAPQVKLEVKVFDSAVAFIFHHTKQQIVDIKSFGAAVTVNINNPAELEILNLGEFNRLAKNLKVSKDQKTITFAIKENFKSRVVIHGEKLTAIEFATEKKEETQKDEQKLPEQINQVQENIITDTEQLIEYTVSKKGAPSLVFNKQISAAQIAVFFRGQHLWVIFDKPQQFTFVDNKILSNLTQIKNNQGSILRFNIKDYNNAQIEKIASKLTITLSKNFNRYLDKKNQSLIIEDLHDQEGIRIAGDFANNSFIEFYDPELGNLIKVITSNVPGVKLQQYKEMVGFKIIPAILGVAVDISSEEVEFIKDKTYLSIVSKHNLPTVSSNTTTKEVQAKFSITDQEGLSTLLPVIDKKLDIINFNNNKSRLLLEASLADPEDQYAKRYELAKFYFLQGLYPESLGVLSLIKNSSAKEYNSNLQIQFQTAVASTLVGKLNNAQIIYDYLLKNTDPTKSGEIALWSSYNEFMLGNNPTKIGFADNLYKSIKSYPDNIYWPLAFAEIELALLANDLKLVDSIFKDLRVASGKFANSLNYYKADYYRKKGQFNLAEQLLQDLTKRDDDPFNVVRSEIDLVKLQLSRKEINRDTAIQRLNAVKFDWRGDTLEYDLLMLLATYYSENNDSFNALRTYKYIQSAFYNKLSNFYITSEMVRIFNEIFLPGGSLYQMDDFTAVALFYEFKDLTPIGSDGDKVILEIARKLVKLDLLDNAAGLLTHQVKYRLRGEERVNIADYLAVVLLLDKKPTEAVQILDETDKDNFKFDEYQRRIMLRAKALIDLKNYSEALTYLKNDYSPDAIVLKKECLFQGEKWQEYIDLVGPEAKNIGSKKIEGPWVQDLVRLAIAYHMLNNQSGLKELYESLPNNDETLKGVIDLLLVSGNPIDYRNLDDSLNINQMQMLLDKYKNYFLDQAN